MNVLCKCRQIQSDYVISCVNHEYLKNIPLDFNILIMDGWKDRQHYHLYAPKRSVILYKYVNICADATKENRSCSQCRQLLMLSCTTVFENVFL